MLMKIRTACRGMISLALVAACVFGCEDTAPSVELLVQTDLAPGVDFHLAEVAPIAPIFGSGERVLPGAEVRVLRDDDFRNGRSVAVFGDVAAGLRYFRARLRREDGTLVVENCVAVRVADGITRARVVLDRDCVGVECPVAGGSAALLACVGGRCVDPARCDPSAEPPRLDCDGESADPAAPPALCDDARPCPDALLECGRRYECDPGTRTCRVSETDLCRDEEVCALREGCVARREDRFSDAGPIDGGGSDAGPADAGSPDGGESDAGPDDAGSDAGAPDAGPMCSPVDRWESASGLLPDEAGWGVQRAGTGFALMVAGTARIDTRASIGDAFAWEKSYESVTDRWRIRGRGRVLAETVTDVNRGVIWVVARRGTDVVYFTLTQVGNQVAFSGAEGTSTYIATSDTSLLCPGATTRTYGFDFELDVNWAVSGEGARTATAVVTSDDPCRPRPDGTIPAPRRTVVSAPIQVEPGSVPGGVVRFGDQTARASGVSEWDSFEVEARRCP